MIILVTYNLKPGKSNSSLLFDAIKSQGRWWHYLKNTWLLKTNKSPDEVFDALKPYLEDGDRLLVTEMGSNRQGWLPQKAWDWIERHED